MVDRTALRELLTSEPAAFAAGAAEYVGSVEPYESFDPDAVPVPTDELLDRERRLLWKARVLEDARFGVVLSGAAYEDNQIIYANRYFRDLSGHDLDWLVGENPRFLQGPDTESDSVTRLHEALRTWEPATVDLWNYRRDGEQFRNRVSLVPIPDAAGTVTHWFGIQERLDR
jgi:PAS domain S-box-containing protein